MHPEVVDDRAGTCPICKMPLEPIRLDSAWSCPVHAVIVEAEPGRCRICGRELVHVTVAVAWTCADRPGTDRLEPGDCADGTPARVKYTPRPHGNHNPQHGGQFFMAPDYWHHLEGVYPRPGVFQLHVYDDYSKPLSAAQLRLVSARVTTTNGNATLARVRGRDFFQAPVGNIALPAQITAHIRFTPGGPEHRFDFTFPTYSADSRGRVSVTEQSPSGADNRPPPVPALVAQLRQRAREVAAAIDRGAFGELYVPAFAAKDLALAIDARAVDAAPPRRAEIEAATSRLVRAAWMLDAAGDIGNADQIRDAYSRFAAALNELDAALARVPQ